MNLYFLQGKIVKGRHGHESQSPNLKNEVSKRIVTFGESSILNQKHLQNGISKDFLQQVENEILGAPPKSTNLDVEDSSLHKVETSNQKTLQKGKSIAVSRPRRKTQKFARCTNRMAYALLVVHDDSAVVTGVKVQHCLDLTKYLHV